MTNGDVTVPAIRALDAKRETSWLSDFLTLLKTELSSFPGRPLLVFRIVLACTLVMLAILVFRIPGGVLGAYFPLLVSRDNLHATRRSAGWIAMACTLGAGETVLGAMLFVGSPSLHLLWVCVSLFAVFYLISTLKVYEAALALGLFITNTIAIWDQSASADFRLRQTLFTLLAILAGCAITVLVEYCFSQTHAPDAVVQGIRERLDITRRALLSNNITEEEHRALLHAARRYAARGTESLRIYVAQAGYSFEERQRLSTAVDLAGRLIDLSISLLEIVQETTPADREVRSAIARNLAEINRCLSHNEAPEWIDIEYDTDAFVLSEIQRTTDLIAESLSQTVWDKVQGHIADRRPKSGKIFADDVFCSTEHIKFAIRGSLSALVCYFFYMSVGWIGLGSSMATCILTALPITGAARHKQLMRFAGVVLGACVLGFTAQIVVLPQIDSILNYTLVFAAVTVVGAWIGTSGPRIAYCGIQIVLAYELVNLNRFSLNPSLVPARDTVLGIALGIGAMWLIFDHLWATSSTESLRKLLTTTILEIANLNMDQASSPEMQNDFLWAQSNRIMTNFDRIKSLSDVSVYEAFPKNAADNRLLRQIKDKLPQLRAVLLIKTGLLHHRAGSIPQCPSDLPKQVLQYSAECLKQQALFFSGKLDRTDAITATSGPVLLRHLNADITKVREGQLDCDLIELRLSSSLSNIVQHLTDENMQ